MASDAAVTARDVWRWRGGRAVLRGLSLVVPAGRSVAILGGNGAGKTTLLKVLAALLRPSRGLVRVHGEDPYTSPSARRRIGFVGHEPMLYGGLTVLENLRLFSRLYGLRDAAARARRACEALDLEAYAETPVRQLSRGLLQRAALARALLHEPDVLLLDEALTGLDPEAADRLGRLVQGHRTRGGTVVLTTHSAQEACVLAQEAYVLARGTLWGPRTLDGVDQTTVVAWLQEAQARR